MSTRYIIRITDNEKKIRYYRGIKKNPYTAFGHLADWSYDKSEALVFNDKDKAIREACGLNEIAIVVSTQVIELSDDGKENCILTLGVSELKRKAIQAVDSYIEKKYGKANST